MKRYCLLLLVPILLGCSVSTGRDAYERALAYVEQGDAPQALACLKEAARKATHDSLRVMVYNEMGSLLFNEGLQEQALDAYLMAYQANCRLSDTIGFFSSFSLQLSQIVCIFAHELLIKIAKAYEEVSISFHECPAVGRYGCLFIIRLSVIRRKSFGLQ